MTRWCLAGRLVAAFVVFFVPAAAGAGTVTGVSVAPNPAAAGATVTVTVTGTNPCGAAHIIYGDGDAVTYPITGLPTSHTHVYKAGGTYTIVAKGMGNCDGETSTTIRVEGPPPPPPPPPQSTLTAMTLSPNPTRPGTPVTITLEGRGGCGVAVDFGDGNNETLQGELPRRVRHNYLVGGDYPVVATAQAPCTGTHRVVLRVEPVQRPRVTDIAARPNPTRENEAVTITVEGQQSCTVTVDFGDGNSQKLTGAFPLRVSHNYPLAGSYDIVATGDAPCSGVRTTVLDVRRRR